MTKKPRFTWKRPEKDDTPFCYDCQMVLVDRDTSKHQGHQIGQQVDWSKLEQINYDDMSKDFKIPKKLCDEMAKEHMKLINEHLLNSGFCCDCENPNLEIKVCEGCRCHDRPEYVEGGW